MGARKSVTRIVGACLIGVMITSCTTVPYSGIPESQLTPAQIEVRDRAKAFNKTVWEGVGVGIATGALVGALTGRWQNALIGAAAGGVAGAAAGNYIARKQQQYANNEDMLNSMTADVRQKNTDAENLVASLEKVVAEDKLKLASANQKYQEGLIAKADYEKQVASVQDDKKVIGDSIKSAQDQQKTFQEAGADYSQRYPGTSTSAYDQEVSALGAKIQRMSEISNDLAAAG